MQRRRAQSPQRRGHRRGATPLRTTAPRLASAAAARFPDAMVGSRSTATRVTPGAISLSNSSHFALMPYSNWVKPVSVAARSRQAVDKAAPTGSDDDSEDDRYRRGHLLQCHHGGTADARMTSGASAPSSAAYWRIGRHRPRPTGYRSARCGRALQPNSCNRSAKTAAMRVCPSASWRSSS